MAQANGREDPKMMTLGFGERTKTEKPPGGREAVLSGRSPLGAMQGRQELCPEGFVGGLLASHTRLLSRQPGADVSSTLGLHGRQSSSLGSAFMFDQGASASDFPLPAPSCPRGRLDLMALGPLGEHKLLGGPGWSYFSL